MVTDNALLMFIILYIKPHAFSKLYIKNKILIILKQSPCFCRFSSRFPWQSLKTSKPLKYNLYTIV